MSDDKPEAEKAEAEQPAADPALVAVGAAAPEPSAPSTAEPKADADHVVRTTETTATKEEQAELQLSAPPKPDEPKRNGGTPAHADGHAHGDDHGHGGHDDHGLAHTTPVSLLFGILGALLVLTIATVAVTAIDLGAQGNLIVAMVIATVKALLVCTFFMHLLWDKKFNLVLFLTSVLFLILFLSMTTADRGETQHLIDEYRAQPLGTK
jgi:cytochrome c oxidase subunit IV